MRSVAAKAIGMDGKQIAHSTVRNALTETVDTIRLETLASICDAIGVDVVSILTGEDFAYVTAPDGYSYNDGARVRVVPVTRVARAASWSDDIKDPGNVSSVVYLPLLGTESYMAAVAEDASMAPRVNKGDVVVFKKGPIKDGELAIVEIGRSGFSVLRTAQQRDGMIYLKARNPEFGEQSASIEQVSFSAQVVMVIEKLTPA